MIIGMCTPTCRETRSNAPCTRDHMHAHAHLLCLLQESPVLGLPFEGIDLAAVMQRPHVGFRVYKAKP